MVQNLLATATATIAIWAVPSGSIDIGLAEAREIALQFRELASKNPTGQSLGEQLPPHEIQDYNIAERPLEYGFAVTEGIISVKKSNGSITWLDISRYPGGYPLPVWQNSAMLSQSEILNRGQYYWLHAGHSEQISIREIVRWYADPATANQFRVYLTRYIDGLRQHPIYDGEIDLEHITGRLYFLSAPICPLPPSPQSPGISASTALLNMVNYLAENTGQTYFYEVIPTCLVSWAPRSDDLSQKYNELTSSDILNGNNNQGVLTYWAELAAPMESDDSVPLVRYWVNVDAATGRVFGGARNGSYLGAAVKKQKTIWLNLEPGDIKIISGKNSESVKNASLSQVATSTKSVAGKPLLLVRHKVIWSLKYDSKTGLLWVRDGIVWKGARPSANLRKVVEKLVR